MHINDLWNSNKESDWENSLTHYWDLIKPSNIDLERKIENLDNNTIKNMNLEEFYNFLADDYFKWKYTDCRWKDNNIGHFSKYASEEKLEELLEVKNDLFSFNLNDVELGLKIAHRIRGLGIAGASGLLSVLFPSYFGTVDQFVVKALLEIENLPEKSKLLEMDPMNLKYSDGVLLINIMKNKADELNMIFHSEKWSPRSIDKILWTTRDGAIKTKHAKVISEGITSNYNTSDSIEYINGGLGKINIGKYIVNNSISSKDKKILKSLFIKYLIKNHPELNTVDTYFSDAMFILNNKKSLKLDFIDTVFDDEDFSIYRERLVEHFMRKGWSFKKSNSQSQYYIKAISLFRDFIDNGAISNTIEKRSTMSKDFLYDSEERFEQLVKRDGTNESDVERRAMFYILAGNYDLYSKIDFIYDFKDHSINIDCLENEDVDFSSSSSNLIKLAFNLYNGYPADVLSTFVGLDGSNFSLALKAIEIRFGKMDVNIIND